VSHKRRVLLLLAQELSLGELQSIASTLDVRSGRSKSALVDALVSSRTAGLAAILGCCSRASLKEVCVQLELSDAGKELDVLIARIVDGDDLSGWNVPELRTYLTNYVRVPDELSKAERAHVRRHFDELMEQASPKGIRAAGPLVNPAAARLRKAAAPWKHRVAELAERLAALAEAPPEGPSLAGPEVQAVVAAVRYFATSESVLPDWDARTAIDDAYAFDLCHEKLGRPALLAIASDLD
jgi:hypothetical protein